jgi:hypothetical protein
LRIPDDAVVVDVGGWAKPLPRADWVIDLLPYETRGLYGASDEAERFTQETWVQRDICDRDPWPFADDQFDYAVCAHTLEDVRDPVGVCRELGRVAKAGYVELPAPVEELTWGIQGEWVGWTHHHWITELVDGELVFTAKPHLLCAAGRHLPRGSADGKERVIRLEWEGTLRAREQVLVGADEFDPWLDGLLARHATKPRRRRFRR